MIDEYEEKQIRKKAKEFLDGQHITDQPFYNAIASYMAQIPVNRTGMKYCPACESAACGVCGQCHVLDKELVFLGPECPLEVETRGTSSCVAWSWGYLFLRQAEKAINGRPAIGRKQDQGQG